MVLFWMVWLENYKTRFGLRHLQIKNVPAGFQSQRGRAILLLCGYTALADQNNSDCGEQVTEYINSADTAQD